MTTLIVTTLSDTPSQGELTLRQAVKEAGAGDTIEFAQGLHGSVILTKNLTIDKSVTIDGSEGSAFGMDGAVSVDANNCSVIVTGSQVTLAHMEVEGGAAGAPGTPDGPDGSDGDTGSTGDPGGQGGVGETRVGPAADETSPPCGTAANQLIVIIPADLAAAADPLLSPQIPRHRIAVSYLA